MDFTVVAYTTLGLSLLVSAIKVGDWILHADPRTIINSGRWALIALALLALAVLLVAHRQRPLDLRDDACGLHAAGARASRAALAGAARSAQRGACLS